ncbi:MAG: hypothetical protein PVI23_14485 [Maricaulaceae bacterium]|jgi:hypothetical protein
MSETIYVGSKKGLFTFTRNGKGWKEAGEPAFIGEPVSQVLVDTRDGAIYAALHLGHFGHKLHRSDDGGKSWEEIGAPRFADEAPPTEWTPPESAEDMAAMMEQMRAPKSGPSVEMIWSLAAGGPDEPGVLWAGTIPGGLFKSTDRGDSWQLNDALWNDPAREKWGGGGFDRPGIHSFLVDPRDSKKVTLAISSGGVWKSADGGESWEQAGQGLRAEFLPPEMQFDPIMQDPHLIVACKDDPDTVWCQHHNGIFKSEDAGSNFVEFKDVKPAVFGFAVAVHPNDPKTAWFVPGIKDQYRMPVDGKFVVNRTRDGGETFEQLSKGLPDAPAWDLVYRHGLDIDETGDKLAMGSTTGNAWVTEDGGESWSILSHHLPPVNVVKWG